MYKTLYKFTTVASETRQGQFYDVMLCVAEINNVEIPYLSCNCKAWTAGRWQDGKDLQERKCKHTQQAILENLERWNEVLANYRFATLSVLSKVVVSASTRSRLGSVSKIR